MNRDISDIFNECIDRLAAGETLDSIVADYPDIADELRDYLQLGLIVGNIKVATDEVQHAKQDGRARLADLLSETSQEAKTMNTQREKPKRKSKKTIHPIFNWRVLSGVAAAFVIMIALGLVALGPAVETVYIPPLSDTSNVCTSVYQNPTVQRRIQGNFVVNDNNQAVQVITATPNMRAEGAVVLSTPAPMGTPERERLETADDSAVEELAVIPADPDIVTTSVYSGAYEADGDVALGGVANDAYEEFDSSETAWRGESEETSGRGGTLGFGYETSTTADLEVRRQVQQPLQAGEINDNAEWDAYMTYRNNYLTINSIRTVADLDVTDRQIIRVQDAQGNPVQGACVQVYNGELLVHESLTYATGLTMFFPNLSDSTRYVDEFRIEVSAGTTTVGSVIDREAVGSDVTTVVVDGVSAQPNKLDIVFLLDATGSMSDEIRQLQDNILAISEQLDDQYSQVDIRYGLVHYRDISDAYVVAYEDFTDDVGQFQSDLNDVVAGGGGDTPEELDTGLNWALNSLSWRNDGDTIKLVFVVADAPPHFERYPDYNYSHMSQDALARGIKIHTLASSGLQPDGEYILRQIAQVTMGNFIFLTYDDGTPGTPGEDRPDLEVGEAEDEQGVGDYSVEQLDELVLQLIVNELEAAQR